MANAEKTVSKKTTGKKSTSKKPVTSARQTSKKAGSKKVVPQKTAGKIPPVQQTADNASLQEIDPDYRRRMIAETSYYIAERHGFVNSSPVDDWLEAEALVDRLIESGEAGHGTSLLSSEQ